MKPTIATQITPAVHSLDERGRCCGRKPLVYKRPRPGHFFCARCDRAFNLETGIQTENWAWKFSSTGFVTTKRSASEAGSVPSRLESDGAPGGSLTKPVSPPTSPCISGNVGK